MTRLQPRSRRVVTIEAAHTLRAAAERMRSEAVGALVVTENGCPVGLVTDRDLLVRGVVAKLDAARATVAEVMSAPLHTAPVDEPLEGIVARMSEHGVRRLPLVAGAELAGMVSLDDLVIALDDELDAIAAAFRRSDWDAQRRRRRARPRAWLARSAARASAGVRRSLRGLQRAWARLAR